MTARTPLGQGELVFDTACRADGTHVGYVTFNPYGLGGIRRHRTAIYETDREAYDAALRIVQTVFSPDATASPVAAVPPDPVDNLGPERDQDERPEHREHERPCEAAVHDVAGAPAAHVPPPRPHQQPHGVAARQK